MKIFFISYFVAATAMLIIDLIWLTIMMKPFYQKYIGHLLSSTPNIVPAIIFYIIFIFGLTFLVIIPALTGNFSYLKLFMYGALFGLVAYGTYDLTNHATMKNWPAIVTIVDLIWGSLLTGTVSIITKFVIRFFS
jgi:uncharacterized membrane protein